MMRRYVLTHSNDGIVHAKREIAWAKSAGADQPALKKNRQLAPRLIVGVWDLEAWLARLGGLIDALNKAQSTFVFYEVDAAIPAGLISRPERVTAWYQRETGRKPNKNIREDLHDNLIADDFFGLAETIRTDLTLDYIIGVTPSMVAGFDKYGLYLNHFSTFRDRTALASSYELHDFARDTGWPFEAFLAKVIVTQLLVTVMWPTLGFHPDTGCLFDYDENRISLKDKVKDPHIEPSCLNEIESAYRPAALAFVDLLRSYGRAK